MRMATAWPVAASLRRRAWEMGPPGAHVVMHRASGRNQEGHLAGVLRPEPAGQERRRLGDAAAPPRSPRGGAQAGPPPRRNRSSNRGRLPAGEKRRAVHQPFSKVRMQAAAIRGGATRRRHVKASMARRACSRGSRRVAHRCKRRRRRSSRGALRRTWSSSRRSAAAGSASRGLGPRPRSRRRVLRGRRRDPAVPHPLRRLRQNRSGVVRKPLAPSPHAILPWGGSGRLCRTTRPHARAQSAVVRVLAAHRPELRGPDDLVQAGDAAKHAHQVEVPRVPQREPPGGAQKERLQDGP